MKIKRQAILILFYISWSFTTVWHKLTSIELAFFLQIIKALWMAPARDPRVVNALPVAVNSSFLNLLSAPNALVVFLCCSDYWLCDEHDLLLSVWGAFHWLVPSRWHHVLKETDSASDCPI